LSLSSSQSPFELPMACMSIALSFP
jgi:hypothetical protein